MLLTARGGRDCVAIREKGKKERQKEGKEKKSNAKEAKMGRAEMDGGIRSTDRRLEKSKVGLEIGLEQHEGEDREQNQQIVN